MSLLALGQKKNRISEIPKSEGSEEDEEPQDSEQAADDLEDDLIKGIQMSYVKVRQEIEFVADKLKERDQAKDEVDTHHLSPERLGTVRHNQTSPKKKSKEREMDTLEETINLIELKKKKPTTPVTHVEKIPEQQDEG